MACPDKFRGTLTASEAARALSRGLDRAGFADVRSVPLADGGEGTLDALLATRGGRRRRLSVTGPRGDRLESAYGLLRDGTAVVEMALASGLTLLEGTNDPLVATTRGTGELMAAAIRNGARHVVVGVGGSATTDGGIGALEALGWSFHGAEVVVACDVTTPFLDAARVYGPQKGATAAQVEFLTRRLEGLASDYVARTGVDVTGLEGAGAAGGLAGGLAALGARLEPGFEVVAEAAGLRDALEGAHLVVTGEGRLDPTSFAGKVVGEVLGRSEGAERRALVVGEVAGGAADDVPRDVRVECLLDRAFDTEDAHTRAAILAEEAALEIGRWALP